MKKLISFKKKRKHVKDPGIFTDPEMASRVEKEAEIPEPPSRLDADDLILFNLVLTGKLQRVKAIIVAKDASKYHEKMDEHGYTIWHIAVHRQDEAMLDYLLNFVKIDIVYDLLLHAIYEQNLSTIKSVLETMKRLAPYVKKPSDLEPWKYSEYPRHITPIILAAQIGSYSLIKFFFELGEEFTPIYAQARGSTDPDRPMDMRKNYVRLHEYQAKASPEMLCYRTNTEPRFDPMLEGFQLIEELKLVGRQEHEFREKYDEIRSKLEDFLVVFLNECRNTDDLKTLLSQKEGYHGKQDKYPRLMLAIENRFYSFVTHCHSQKMLYLQWAGDAWPEWKAHGNLWKFGQITMRFFLSPIILIWLYFDFFSNASKFFRAPINRCIHDFISYIYFMGLLAYEAYLLTCEETFNLHDTPCKTVEVLIILFVMGHVVNLFRHFLIAPQAFFFVRWNWYEIITILFFLTTFGFWITTWYNENVSPVPKGIPRTHWPYYDSVLCGQAAYAFALVFAYGKFMRFFQMNSITGPMQITMGEMVEDVAVFVFFFAIVMLSFALGFYFLYSPFDGLTEAMDGDTVRMSDAFTTYPNALHNVFWGLLGMSSADSAEILTFTVAQNGTENVDGTNSLYVTETTGKSLWIVYHLLGPMILMNMLTGYMGNTFSKIVGNMDAIWKFNRAQVWVYYSRSTVMPPPFNVLPALKDLCICYKWIVSSGERAGKQVAACSVEACCYLEERENSIEKSNRIVRYNNLMRRLVQRYLRSKLAVNERESATHEDVEQIAEKISVFKESLGKALSKSSVKTQLTPSQEKMETHWAKDEQWLAQYSKEPLHSFQWITKARPVPSPIRQSFTPQVSSLTSTATKVV